MEKITMKVVDWDESSMSLIVKFNSDINETNIDQATPLAYQPMSMFPNVEDINEVVKRVAVSGIHLCEMRSIEEQNRKNEEKLQKFRQLKDQTFEFTVDELLNMDNRNINSIVDEVSGNILEQTDSTLNTEEL
jgi:hypothetical protein